jgi:hypothetical protein
MWNVLADFWVGEEQCNEGGTRSNSRGECVLCICNGGNEDVAHLDGTIAYKCKFQPTVAGSPTEAEFMAAYDTGKMILFVRSILWDLDVPQEAATLLYEDNDGYTAMGNAQKLTPRTHYIDIKHFSLCEWVEGDLILLDRMDTSINMSDHLTKSLQTLLFYCHTDFLLGHIPPSYSPIYSTIVGTYTNHTINVDKFIPQSFTTPLTAAAAQVYAPLRDDYVHSQWLHILRHGDTIQCSNDSFCLSSSLNHFVHTGL